MKRRSEPYTTREEDVNKIIGLGSKSIRKSYYPELKNKIASLDRQNVFYQSILNSIPDSVVITDSSGVIVQINPALTERIGYSDRELVGKHFSILHTDNTKEFTDSQTWPESAKPYRCKDGSILIGEVSSSEIHDKAGNLLGYLEVIRDITERIENEQKQRKLEQQLLQSRKMEAIGSLAGGIAHDFNNILSGIIGYAELIELFAITDIEQIREYIGEILQASYRARDLVQQILTFSRRGEQQFATTELTSIVREAMRLIQASLADSIRVKTFFETSNDQVLADSTQLHQVITNLCTNAVYAMRDRGGLLSVRIAEVEQEEFPDIPYGVELPQKMVLLEIQDTGCGIPKEVLDHIFEPYFTTKSPGEGTGFGLALVHGIVKSHGGYIEVESVPGQGSCFRIFLPQQQWTEVHYEKSTASLPASGHGRVMLVDDERAQLEWGKEFLTRIGYVVTTFDSGTEALAHFTASPTEVDLIITDQTMPALTGLELSQKIRAMRRDVPIILCTGYSHALPQEEIQALGATAILHKPYRLRELVDSLQRFFS